MSAPEVISPDLRNVANDFKYFPIEVIKQRLAERRRPFATMCLNLDKDLNVASVLRTHNAFCGLEFFWLGRKKFYRPGAVGTYIYETMRHVVDLPEALEKAKEYTWIGLDNRPGAVSIKDFSWETEKPPLLIFGHEQGGLDFLPDLAYHCKHIVMIPQAGSVRSLNVGVSAGIAMFDLCMKKGWM